MLSFSQMAEEGSKVASPPVFSLTRSGAILSFPDTQGAGSFDLPLCVLEQAGACVSRRLALLPRWVEIRFLFPHLGDVLSFLGQPVVEGLL